MVHHPTDPGQLTDAGEATAETVRELYPGCAVWYSPTDTLAHARLIINVSGRSWQDVIGEIQAIARQMSSP